MKLLIKIKCLISNACRQRGEIVSEYELIKRCIEGDRDSFDNLLKSRSEKMYKIAFSYVKNQDLALDVVSEATFKCYINIKKIKNVEYFDTWLCKIVINEALSMLKKQKKVISIEDYKKDIESKVNLNIEEKIDLYYALDKLKKDEKKILVLKHFADLTFADISSVMIKSENTVKTTYYRALDKAKKILQGG